MCQYFNKLLFTQNNRKYLLARFLVFIFCLSLLVFIINRIILSFDQENVTVGKKESHEILQFLESYYSAYDAFDSESMNKFNYFDKFSYISAEGISANYINHQKDFTRIYGKRLHSDFIEMSYGSYAYDGEGDRYVVSYKTRFERTLVNDTFVLLKEETGVKIEFHNSNIEYYGLWGAL